MSHEDYFKEAGVEAQKAECLRDKCGAVVVLNGEIIGRGFSSPAGGLVLDKNGESNRKCELNLITSAKPKSDRTCCVHAEWRAIISALKQKNDTQNLNGSILYFTRVDGEGNILKSGEPYCTVCSRLALDNGISYLALWHESGIKLYNTREYNELSYQFHQKN